MIPQGMVWYEPPFGALNVVRWEGLALILLPEAMVVFEQWSGDG